LRDSRERENKLWQACGTPASEKISSGWLAGLPRAMENKYLVTVKKIIWYNIIHHRDTENTKNLMSRSRENLCGLGASVVRIVPSYFASLLNQ
jgi:hypothetical protein